MYKQEFNKREVLVFKQFQRKGYSLFACLGREVIISVLSVATLSSACAAEVSVQPVPADTVAKAASDKELLLDEVSVTGSRAPLTESQAARIVTVLDREAIQAAPVQSVNDLLKYAAGVDVRQRGPIGAQTDISIRGGNYEQITILLNGINIGDPQTGHNVFDFPVDVSGIERIEVLEGPAARVFSTSSLVGAINIVTKMPRQSSVSAHLDGGSYGYLNTGARINLASGHWNNQVSGSYVRSDGYSRSKAGRLNADIKGGKAFYQGSYDDDDVRVSWHAGLSSKDYGSNTFYGVKWDDQFEHTFKTYTALSAENKRGRFHIRPTIYWNHNYDRFELYRDDDAVEHGVAFNYHRSDVFGANINTYFDWLLGRTALSAELRNEDLVSTTLGEELNEAKHIHGTDRDYTKGLNRTNISFVLEHNVLLRRFTASAGIVAVKNSWNEAPMKLYPGIDLSYRIAGGLKAYASYNSSLRMPSATELYYSVGGHKADKRLKPEELQAVEGGLKYAAGGITASASVYYHHGKNMIDWIRNVSDGDDAPWQSVNFTKINTTGFELMAALDFRQLLPSQRILKNFRASYSYINQDKDVPEDIQSRYTLEYLRHKVVAELAVNIWKNLDLTAKYRFQERTGSFTNADGEVQSYQPYSIIDARLQWTGNVYKVYMEANNLLDKSYYDHGCVPQPGLWVMAGAAIDINL